MEASGLSDLTSSSTFMNGFRKHGFAAKGQFERSARRQMSLFRPWKDPHGRILATGL